MAESLAVGPRAGIWLGLKASCAVVRRLAVLLVATAACGGAHYQGDLYDDGEARYRLASPEQGWSAVDVERSVDLAWTHRELAAVMSANARCNPALDIPLVALTNHLLIGFTDRELLNQELVPMDGREAMRTHVTAKLDGVPRELLLTVLKKDGCVYDFHLAAPPGPRFGRAKPIYEQLVESFATR